MKFDCTWQWRTPVIHVLQRTSACLSWIFCSCFWFFLEPIVIRGESYGFLSKLLDTIKVTVDANDAANSETNKNLYGTCDLAAGVMSSKVGGAAKVTPARWVGLPNFLWAQQSRWGCQNVLWPMKKRGCGLFMQVKIYIIVNYRVVSSLHIYMYPSRHTYWHIFLCYSWCTSNWEISQEMSTCPRAFLYPRASRCVTHCSIIPSFTWTYFLLISRVESWMRPGTSPQSTAVFQPRDLKQMQHCLQQPAAPLLQRLSLPLWTSRLSVEHGYIKVTSHEWMLHLKKQSTSWDKPLVFSPLESTDFFISLSRAKLPRNETAKEPAGSKKSVEKPKASRKQASKRRTEKVPAKSVSNGGLERNHSHFPW